MKMKKTLRMLSVTGAAFVLFYGIPVVAWNLVRPNSIEGIDRTGAHCVCGYEVFYAIRGTNVFETCPGHGDDSLRTYLVPTNDHWVSVIPKKHIVFEEVRYADGAVEFTSLLTNRPPFQLVLQKLKNPWRV
jgi:hypothetical protein